MVLCFLSTHAKKIDPACRGKHPAGMASISRVLKRAIHSSSLQEREVELWTSRQQNTFIRGILERAEYFYVGVRTLCTLIVSSWQVQYRSSVYSPCFFTQQTLGLFDESLPRRRPLAEINPLTHLKGDLKAGPTPLSAAASCGIPCAPFTLGPTLPAVINHHAFMLPMAQIMKYFNRLTWCLTEEKGAKRPLRLSSSDKNASNKVHPSYLVWQPVDRYFTRC